MEPYEIIGAPFTLWVADTGTAFPTLDEAFSTSSSASTFLPNPGLRKERSNNVEAGFALSGYDMLQSGDAGQIKVTGFYNDIADLIALDPTLARGAPGGPPAFNAVPGIINIDRAEIYGF